MPFPIFHRDDSYSFVESNWHLENFYQWFQILKYGNNDLSVRQAHLYQGDRFYIVDVISKSGSKNLQMEPKIESIPFCFFKINIYFEVFVSPIKCHFCLHRCPACHIRIPANSWSLSIFGKKSAEQLLQVYCAFPHEHLIRARQLSLVVCRTSVSIRSDNKCKNALKQRRGHGQKWNWYTHL